MRRQQVSLDAKISYHIITTKCSTHPNHIVYSLLTLLYERCVLSIEQHRALYINFIINSGLISNKYKAIKVFFFFADQVRHVDMANTMMKALSHLEFMSFTQIQSEPIWIDDLKAEPCILLCKLTLSNQTISVFVSRSSCRAARLEAFDVTKYAPITVNDLDSEVSLCFKTR